MEMQSFAPGQEHQETRIYVEALVELKVGAHTVGPGHKYTHAWLTRKQVKRLQALKRVRLAQPPQAKPAEESAPVSTETDSE